MDLKRIPQEMKRFQDPERYRSGRNGIDSKSIWGPKALTGVRIPLSPPDGQGVRQRPDALFSCVTSFWRTINEKRG